MEKYQLRCVHCGTITQNFKEWFAQNQGCAKCGSKHSEIEYNADYGQLKELFEENPDNFWLYFDYLPLESKENIVTCNEGAIPIEEWGFLEKFASEKYGIDCRVMVYRNDLNGGTQTFKDVAGALASAVFKENKVGEYCAASTGNTATAFSKYLSLSDVKFSVFVPQNINNDSVEEMQSYGQNVIRVDGDYAFAKKEAAGFSEKNKVLISIGNIDPIRVEAKKTMVFEFLRQLGKMPDVYIQAISGGTGPIAIDKGIREIAADYPEATLPRMIMVQQDRCDPMVTAWENAREKGFPENYEKEYPVIDNPETIVSILSTGNPGMFPVVAPIIKKSGGAFLRVKEAELVDYARMLYKERNLLLGPASIVCFMGFFKALEEGEIKNGETVLINTGEGAARASEFVKMVQG